MMVLCVLKKWKIALLFVDADKDALFAQARDDDAQTLMRLKVLMAFKSLNFIILWVEKLARPRCFRPQSAGFRRVAVLAATPRVFSY